MPKRYRDFYALHEEVEATFLFMLKFVIKVLANHLTGTACIVAAMELFCNPPPPF